MQSTQAVAMHKLLRRRLTTGFTASFFGLHYTSSCIDGALRVSLRCAASSSSAAASTKVDHYRCLGVDTDATPQTVKAAYRQLALRYHPDVAEDADKVQAEVLFRRVSEAYEVLSDPVKRRAHDTELGIQTRRRQPVAPTSAPTAGAKTASTAAPSSGSGVHSARRRRRASATASTAQSSPQHPSSSSRSGQRYRKPFVRGDANRVFADAFDGKSLDEILFDVQRRRRQESAQKAATVPTGSASSSNSTNTSDVQDVFSPSEDIALDKDARLRHMLEGAAESFAQRARRQYGHGILRHIRATTAHLPEGPSTPPGSQMPFRPFVGMEVPAGVRVPPEPELGRVLRPEEATVEGTGEEADVNGSDGSIPVQFHTHTYADGSAQTRMQSLKKVARNIEGMPHNMGQLYSYQRPY